jgi:hypothetical protein
MWHVSILGTSINGEVDFIVIQYLVASIGLLHNS